MVKTISVTNKLVLDTLSNANNASDLVTVAVLYYLNELDIEYIEAYKMLQTVTTKLKKERGQ